MVFIRCLVDNIRTIFVNLPLNFLQDWDVVFIGQAGQDMSRDGREYKRSSLESLMKITSSCWSHD